MIKSSRFCCILKIMILACASHVGLAFESQSDPPTAIKFEFPCVGEEPAKWRLVSPVRVADNRLLITCPRMIYLVTTSGEVRWSHAVEGVITSQPVYRRDRNEIAVIASPYTYEHLNSETGEVEWKSMVPGGRGSYFDLKAFRDAYLVHIDMSGYRQDDDTAVSATQEVPDLLVFWPRDNSPLKRWSIDFPAGASIEVIGEQVFAVMHRDDSIQLQKVFVPQ